MATKRISWSYKLSAIPVTMFAHLVALTIFILVLVWLLHFRGGLAFSSENKERIFNLHPFFMLLGFVLFSGEAIMAYKSIPAPRRSLKKVHMLMHLVALIAAILGVYAVFKFHDEIDSPNMYTLHSWFGMCTICLFGLQWLFAFFSFWYPKAGTTTRTRLTPWHVVFGVIIFFMAILSVETGLTERFHFLGLRRSQEGLIINFTGLLVLLFAIAVGVTVILTKPA